VSPSDWRGKRTSVCITLARHISTTTRECYLPHQ
jgi:hypothetical protein